MKNRFLKIYILIFTLLSSFITFATPQEDPTDPIEDPETPINSKVLWLAIAGIVFAIYYFRKNNSRKSTI